MTLRAVDIQQPKRICVPELRIESGQCIVLCGPNGSGKSSLLRILAGVDTPARGQVTLGKKPLIAMSPLERSAHIAWLPQRSTVGDAWTVEALVASARYRFFESRSVAEQRASELLAAHGLSHLRGRLSSEISGGELQRTLIVSLVAQEASILMLDEPANHLDPKHQIITYQSLGRLWRAGQSVVIVSHDVRLAQLLGDPKHVRVIGVKNAALAFELPLSDAGLHAALGALYDTPFVAKDEPGSLAVDLGAGLIAEGFE